MKESKELGKILKSDKYFKMLLISLLILAVNSIGHADQIKSRLLTHQDKQYIVKSETVRIVTAYNAGDPRQTDDTPCISANGENICQALQKVKNDVPPTSFL